MAELFIVLFRLFIVLLSILRLFLAGMCAYNAIAQYTLNGEANPMMLLWVIFGMLVLKK